MKDFVKQIVEYLEDAYKGQRLSFDEVVEAINKLAQRTNIRPDIYQRIYQAYIAKREQ